uniref:CCHC-type domain-containing protein n=1 Tax=Anopheles culicifacies TaxID=139723 RepID=A0A182MJR8_9DIPT
MDAIEVTPKEGQTWNEMYSVVRAAGELSDLESVLGVGRRTSRNRLVMTIAEDADSLAVHRRVNEDVAEALSQLLQEQVPEEDIIMREAWNGTQTAWVRVMERVAELAAGNKIRIKYTFCLVTQVQPFTTGRQRCFRCLQFGHIQTKCRNETDRSTACIRCGEPGHLARTCTAPVSCAACKGPHRVGSLDCKA